MAQPRTLTLILAGGAGNRMELLTNVRAKPALPFAGVYRLIDFPLSHCVHSQLNDVWVIEQFQPHTLNDHLLNGRPWDLDRTYGGLRILPPHTGTQEGGWHQGNADALYRNRRFLREFNPDLIVLLSADHVYKLDYRLVIEQHLARKADVTMVTTQVPRDQASRFGVVQANGDGKVTSFAYKPDEPQSDTVTTEVFVYNARTLLATIDELAEASGDDAALSDFGDELLPKLVKQGRAYTYPLDGYWRDVGTIESYWQAHMDLLQPQPPIDLDAPAWPILTSAVQRRPAQIHQTAQIDNSLIAMGCQIRGRVINSVLGPGVVVAEDATIVNSIVFEHTVINEGAQVGYAIIDSDVRIGERAQIGQIDAQSGDVPPITLVAQSAQVAAHTQVAAGERVQLNASAEPQQAAQQAGLKT